MTPRCVYCKEKVNTPLYYQFKGCDHQAHSRCITGNETPPSCPICKTDKKNYIVAYLILSLFAGFIMGRYLQ